MTRIIALSLAIAAGSLAAASENESGAYMTLDSARSEAIRAELAAQGYDVRKIKREDGVFEAYALKDGARYEIYLDADLNVIRTEMDD